MLPAVILDFPPATVDQRPDDVLPHRRNPAQALEPGSPGQVEQHRLRQIGKGVGRGDHSVFPGQPPEKLVAYGSAAGFQPQLTLRGLLPDIDFQHLQRDALPLTVPPYVFLIPVRLRSPQAVVYMGRRHLQLRPVLSPALQNVKKRHGIGSPGNPGHHGGIGRKHLIGLNGLQNLSNHCGRPP